MTARCAQIAGKQRRLNGWVKPTGPSRHPLLAVPDIGLGGSARVPLIPVTQDQAQEGSCTAQTVREIMSGLALRDGRGQIVYSAQAMYRMELELDGTAPNDVGSSVETGFTVVTTRGIPHESTWPYSTPLSTPLSDLAIADAAQHKGLLAFNLPNLATIKASIAQGFGVAFGFDVPTQMMSEACAESGLVEYPADDSGWDGGGHAVSCWGYDDGMVIGPYTGALYCLNHWSDQWGVDGGRFWLPYQFVITAHATDFHTLRLAEAT